MDVTLPGIVTLSNSFFKNAALPMDITLSGIITLLIYLHEMHNYLWI